MHEVNYYSEFFCIILIVGSLSAWMSRLHARTSCRLYCINRTTDGQLASTAKSSQLYLIKPITFYYPFNTAYNKILITHSASCQYCPVENILQCKFYNKLVAITWLYIWYQFMHVTGILYIGIHFIAPYFLSFLIINSKITLATVLASFHYDDVLHIGLLIKYIIARYSR